MSSKKSKILAKSPEDMILYIRDNDITKGTMIKVLEAFNMFKVENLNQKISQYICSLAEYEVNSDGEFIISSCDEKFCTMIEALICCECLDVTKILRFYSSKKINFKHFKNFLKVNLITNDTKRAKVYWAIAKYSSENVPYYMELIKRRDSEPEGDKRVLKPNFRARKHIQGVRKF